MPNLQNFKGSSFCRSLGRSLGPKLRPNQDSVDLWVRVTMALVHSVNVSLTYECRHLLSGHFAHETRYFSLTAQRDRKTRLTQRVT